MGKYWNGNIFYIKIKCMENFIKLPIEKYLFIQNNIKQTGQLNVWIDYKTLAIYNFF